MEGGYSAINTNGTPLVGTNTNNINQTPNFTNPSAGIYTLSTGSPCIDSGTTTGIATLIPSLDLAGNPRNTNGQIDIGAYETVGSTTTSIASVTAVTPFSVFPNPNNGTFIVQLDNADFKNAIATVYDIMGRVCYKSSTNNHKFQITLNKPQGIYLVKVQLDETILTKRVIVQ